MEVEMKDYDLLKSYWKVYKYRQEIPFEKLSPEFKEDLSKSLHFGLYRYSCACNDFINAIKNEWIRIKNIFSNKTEGK